jgi:DNA-binding response OmpR family regulator
VTKNSILLIDDEPDITFTIKNILEDNGFKVDSFTDPISALDNYQINYYDLVIGLRVEVHDFLY